MNLPSSTPQRGFTMIEMLVVVAIMGILLAIALPGYRSYVERTNRTVGKAALTTLAARQESYAADHKVYTNSFARLGVSGSGAATTAYLDRQGNLSLTSSTTALYRLTIAAATSTAGSNVTNAAVANCTAGGDAVRFNFLLVATPVSTRTDNRCGTLCLSSSGQRGATGGTENCWGR